MRTASAAYAANATANVVRIFHCRTGLLSRELLIIGGAKYNPVLGTGDIRSACPAFGAGVYVLVLGLGPAVETVPRMDRGRAMLLFLGALRLGEPKRARSPPSPLHQHLDDRLLRGRVILEGDSRSCLASSYNGLRRAWRLN